MNEQELMRDYLDGHLSPEGFDELNRLLENDADSRARFREMATLEEGMRDLSVMTDLNFAGPVSASLPQRTQTRVLAAATFGLAAGVLFTSVIWAAAQSRTHQLITLIQESFEHGPAPLVTGFPLTPGVWSGDFTEIATNAIGLKTSHGNRMLRFLRADYDGKERAVGYFSDVYRLIDLQEYQTTLANDDAVVTVKAAFRSKPFSDPKRFRAGLAFYALSASPVDFEQWRAILSRDESTPRSCLATSLRWFDLSPSTAKWQTTQTSLQLSSDVRFLILQVSVCDQNAGAPGSQPPASEFAGHFVDDIKVTLTR